MVIHSNFPGSGGCTESQAEGNYHIRVLPRRAALDQHQHCQADLQQAEAVLPLAAALLLRSYLSPSGHAHFHMQKHLQERLLQVRAAKSCSSISSSTQISRASAAALPGCSGCSAAITHTHVLQLKYLNDSQDGATKQWFHLAV